MLHLWTRYYTMLLIRHFYCTTAKPEAPEQHTKPTNGCDRAAMMSEVPLPTEEKDIFVNNKSLNNNQ